MSVSINVILNILKNNLLKYFAAKGTQHVTCGSVVKLLNVNYNVRLHSHDIKYGSGSGQQSVTGINTKEDGDSYWFVKAESGKRCIRG